MRHYSRPLVDFAWYPGCIECIGNHGTLTSGWLMFATRTCSSMFIWSTGLFPPGFAEDDLKNEINSPVTRGYNVGAPWASLTWVNDLCAIQEATSCAKLQQHFQKDKVLNLCQCCSGKLWHWSAIIHNLTWNNIVAPMRLKRFYNIEVMQVQWLESKVCLHSRWEIVRHLCSALASAEK